MEKAACHFVFYTGPRKGEAQVFETARISIGRAGNCDFRLEALQLDQISAHHAEVLLEENNAYVLYDLGAKSGTWVNGERVHERCALMNEDYIRFGHDGPEVIFRTGHPSPGKQALPQIFPVTSELEFFSGSDAGRIFPINADDISNIGRRADLEIPLDPRGDMIVSGNHCNIRYVNGHFVLTDSSRNGTYVNNDLLDQPMEILAGDVIMLGDGGPQARFHVDQAKRHYPNHRPLSPVPKHPETKKAFAPDKQELPVQPDEPTSSVSMASAKPYSSGSPVDPPPPPTETDATQTEPEKTADDSEKPDDTFAGQNTDLDIMTPVAESGDSVETLADSSPVSDAPTASLAGASPRRKFAIPALQPHLHKIKFKPGKRLIFAAIAIVVLIGLFMIFFRETNSTTSAQALHGDYAAALESPKKLTSASNTFAVDIPQGWTSRNDDNYIGVESQDKNVNVDYVRDPKLNEAKARELLSRNGATIADKPESNTVDGVKLTTLKASAGDVRRIATLHQPPNGPTALAMLETTKDTLEKLDDATIDKLLVANLELTTIPAAPTRSTQTPQPTKAAAPQLPRPQTANLVTATPARPRPSDTPAATKKSPSTAALTAKDDDTTPTGPAITSKALKLTIIAPNDNWTGASEESDEMVMLKDDVGMEMRIARDPGELDAEATFAAMTEENWKGEGKMIRKPYQAGEFTRDGQNLMLVLVPEKTHTTIVIYATSPKNFNVEQRLAIKSVIEQLVNR